MYIFRFFFTEPILLINVINIINNVARHAPNRIEMIQKAPSFGPPYRAISCVNHNIIWTMLLMTLWLIVSSMTQL